MHINTFYFEKRFYSLGLHVPYTTIGQVREPTLRSMGHLAWQIQGIIGCDLNPGHVHTSVYTAQEHIKNPMDLTGIAETDVGLQQFRQGKSSFVYYRTEDYKFGVILEYLPIGDISDKPCLRILFGPPHDVFPPFPYLESIGGLREILPYKRLDKLTCETLESRVWSGELALSEAQKMSRRPLNVSEYTGKDLQHFREYEEKLSKIQVDLRKPIRKSFRRARLVIRQD